MVGKILIILGFSCTGKTTYIKLLHHFLKERIQRRAFYTNRPPRSKDEFINSLDYTFIDTDEYLYLSQKENWHWTTWFDFEYGFDIPLEIGRIHDGANIVIGAFPVISYLNDMRNIHDPANVVSIFLDVPIDIISSRLLKRPLHERKRIDEFNQQEIEYCKRNADVIFTPTNNLKHDCEQFLIAVKQKL